MSLGNVQISDLCRTRNASALFLVKVKQHCKVFHKRLQKAQRPPQSDSGVSFWNRFETVNYFLVFSCCSSLSALLHHLHQRHSGERGAPIASHDAALLSAWWEHKRLCRSDCRVIPAALSTPLSFPIRRLRNWKQQTVELWRDKNSREPGLFSFAFGWFLVWLISLLIPIIFFQTIVSEAELAKSISVLHSWSLFVCFNQNLNFLSCSSIRPAPNDHIVFHHSASLLSLWAKLSPNVIILNTRQHGERPPPP